MMDSEVIAACILVLPGLVSSVVMVIKLTKAMKVMDSTHKIVNQQRTDMMAEIDNLKQQIASLGAFPNPTQARRVDGKKRRHKKPGPS